MDVFKRIEMRIEIERNPRKREEMRKVLADTLKALNQK